MDKIAGYRRGRLLGEGAFGQTYEATKGGQRVALKLIRPEAVQQGFDPRRFEREVRALQKVVGPNIVRLIDAGAAALGNETRYYIALEYLEGRDLAHAFDDASKVFEESQLRDWLTQIATGLEAIHQQNIVHRDLKPANVFVTDEGEVKLLDFGLVRMLDYTTLTTMPGQPIGTPQYIAPEILRGDDIDYRADFYSLGVLIYHLVTGGKYPFNARTPLELFIQIVNNAPVPPTRHNRSLSSEFENLVLVLLSKQPYGRTFDHDELRAAIQSTPITVSQTVPRSSRRRVSTHPKRCFFRILHNEKRVIEEFVRAGGECDGLVCQASYLPRVRNALAEFRQQGLSYLFDPVTYRLAYSSFAQTKGLVGLPYVPDPNTILTPDALQTLEAQQTYAQGCIDWQLQWLCSTLVAPFHFARDLGSPWMDIDIKLIEESIAYARAKDESPPVYAGLCLNIETYTVESNRLALLNRYSRARADGYLFYVDSMNEKSTNPLQLRAMLELLQLFQRLGKPVFACRTGTLGLGLMAAGIDGATTGIASLSSFSESGLLVNRAAGYDMKTKYYIPGIMLTLPVLMAEDILADRRNAALRCNCVHCRGASSNLARVAKAHFMRVRTEEIGQLNALSTTSERLEWFAQRVADAVATCDRIRRQQIVNLQPGHYSHLRTWPQVFVDPNAETR